MEKRIGLVMLPSKNRNRTGMLLNSGWLLNDEAIKRTGLTVKDLKQFSVFQCLYVFSDDEIQEGDYVLRGTDTIQQVNSHNAYSNTGCITLEYGRRWCKKIIASTNDSLNVNRIPANFINHFILQYNLGNIITKAMVEYVGGTSRIIVPVGHEDYSSGLEYIPFKLKVDSDNTICIRAIKTSWDKEEVKRLCKSSFEMYMTNDPLDDDELSEKFNMWIDRMLM